jgi:hypothetical protein
MLPPDGHAVDRGSFSRGRHLMNRHVGKVASYDGAMLKVTELFSKAVLLPMFVYGDCMAVCTILFFLYTCQQCVWLKSTNLKRPHTFVYMVFLVIVLEDVFVVFSNLIVCICICLCSCRARVGGPVCYSGCVYVCGMVHVLDVCKHLCR